MDNNSTAVRNVMEKISAGAQKNVMQEFVHQQERAQGIPEGKTDPNEYVGGFGEVRRWQQKEPSGQDPEQTDTVTQLKEHPEPIKKASWKDLHTDMAKYLRAKVVDHDNDEQNFNFDVEAAIWWFASDFHSGQDSDLYKILSMSKFHPSPLHNSVKQEGERAQEMYDALVERFKNVRTAARMGDSFEDLLAGAEKGDKAAQETILFKNKDVFLKAAEGVVRGGLKHFLDTNTNNLTVEQFYSDFSDTLVGDDKWWAGLGDAVRKAHETSPAVGLEEMFAKFLIRGVSFRNRLIDYISKVKKDILSPKKSVPILQGDMISEDDLHEMTPQVLVKTVNDRIKDPETKRVAWYWLAPLIGDLKLLSGTGLTAEDIRRVDEFLKNRKSRKGLTEEELGELLNVSAVKGRNMLKKVKRFLGLYGGHRPPEEGEVVEDFPKYASVASLIEDIADSIQEDRAAATLTPPDAIIPDEIKEAVGLLQLVAVNKAANGEIQVSVVGPLTPKQVEDVLKVKSLKNMDSDGKNVKFTFGAK